MTDRSLTSKKRTGYTWSGAGMIPAVKGDKRRWVPAEDHEQYVEWASPQLERLGHEMADNERLRAALTDVSAWLQAALNCEQWEWDSDQRHAATGCLVDAKALLSGNSSAPETSAQSEVVAKIRKRHQTDERLSLRNGPDAHRDRATLLAELDRIQSSRRSGNRSVTLNGYQLQAALELCAPDMDSDQLETDVSIQWGDAGHSGPAYYACLTEYPEEGSVVLDDKADESVQETSAHPEPIAPPESRCLHTWQSFDDGEPVRCQRTMGHVGPHAHRPEKTSARPAFNHERDCGLTNDTGKCECPQPGPRNCIHDGFPCDSTDLCDECPLNGKGDGT